LASKAKAVKVVSKVHATVRIKEILAEDRKGLTSRVKRHMQIVKAEKLGNGKRISVVSKEARPKRTEENGIAIYMDKGNWNKDL
jgi:hypothetical protein